MMLRLTNLKLILLIATICIPIVVSLGRDNNQVPKNGLPKCDPGEEEELAKIKEFDDDDDGLEKEGEEERERLNIDRELLKNLTQIGDHAMSTSASEILPLLASLLIGVIAVN